MIKVSFYMTLFDDITSKRFSCSRVVELPGVPRIGEDVEVSEGGWSEQVRTVYWLLKSSEVYVEVGPLTITFNSDTEDLAETAKKNGWSVS